MLLESRLKDGRRLAIAHVEPTDAAEMVAYVGRVTEETEFLEMGPGDFEMSVDQEKKFIEELQGGRFNFILKAVVGGQIVAACTLMRRARPRVQHLGAFGISVARSHWRLGIGRAMCNAMLQVAREVGVTKVQLQVRADNVNAIRLYEDVGFRTEGVVVRALRVRERYFDHVMMGVCLD